MSDMTQQQRQNSFQTPYSFRLELGTFEGLFMRPVTFSSQRAKNLTQLGQQENTAASENFITR